MATRFSVAAGLVALLLVGTRTPIAASTEAAPSMEEKIRGELLQLPYYGVFDFLAFSYNPSGKVTLHGYAYRGALVDDAARAVRRVEGVREVDNRIERLSVGTMDDDLRWRTYYAIYRDPFLSRYAPGGGLLWGHRHPFGAGRFMPLGGSRFPDSEPAGDYPIHIVVTNSKVMLLGVVDSDTDRVRAEALAKGVTGSLGVENGLVVEMSSK